jgi:hypothetical protein
MVMPKHAKTNRHWGVLAGLLCLLLGVPWLLWAIAIYSEADWTFSLVLPVLFWIEIPAMILREPLFKPDPHGYSPAGIAGWSAATLFYIAIAFGVWIAIRSMLSLREKPDI